MNTTSTNPTRIRQPRLEATPTPHPRRRWLHSVAGQIINAAVFSTLAAMLYIGHHNGWKLPTLSELRGTASQERDDWCSEHLVPGSSCVECKADLLPKSLEFGFCRRHGVAECVIDHPELAQLSGEPESLKYDTAAALELMARPENNSKSTLHKQRVQFPSSESAAKFGLDVDVVGERSMSDVIAANGELTFDPTRVAHLSSRVDGTVAAVLKVIGEEVRAGDVLLIVDSARVGEGKSALLRAIVERGLRQSTAQRLRSLASEKLVTAKALAEAEAALKEAEISIASARQALVNFGFDVPEAIDEDELEQLEDELRFLGLPRACIEALPSGAGSMNLIPVRAPYEGVVITSDVVAGEVVETTKALLTVADPRRLWLLLNVRQEDAKYVSLGLPVRFISDDGSQQTDGHISWINPSIDARTRTLEVRVVVNNADGRLRGHTFGSGAIVLREEPNAVVVPVEAVQSTNDAHFVFVRDKDYLKEGSFKIFHVRQVRLGAHDGGYVELLAGALPGEVVATKGSAAILAQLLRSNLGAGCDCCN
ncbi:MAG TPA: efflux RND transporter periplasmic adaptor subunit [Gemmataceae bacterium]|nr:efflux RND transporter periplasmic adaptor subunit [Gemmataceae bacterium]